MTRFSANLGFLWADRPLPEAIRRAKSAGFDAVECHWPYDQPTEPVRAALVETGLAMIGLNTRRGHAGENGLSGLPGREADAQAAIDEAITYAEAIDAGAIHVMAGFAEGAAATRTFVKNLCYAAGATDRMILIEPLNQYDAPGYFLKTTDQARAIIDEVAVSNLKLMFDCYHVGRTEGDVASRIAALMTYIGHIQFASVPDRGPPDHGDVDYQALFAEIARLGWEQPLGAEYKVSGPTDQHLAWLDLFKGQAVRDA
ncbi:MAG: TIM barrel protein [Pseudomonadota bacterium]